MTVWGTGGMAGHSTPLSKGGNYQVKDAGVFLFT